MISQHALRRGLRSALFFAGLMAVLVCASGCFFTPEQAAADQFVTERAKLSPQCVSLEDRIPYVSPDSKDSCGLNCLDMIFALHQLPIPTAVVEPLRDKAALENGISVDDIVRVLQTAGFKTLRRQGILRWPGDYPAGEPFRDINNPLCQIAFGRLPILRLQLKPGVFHFVVVAGYDESTKNLIVITPGLGKVVWPLDTFLPLWEGGERVFIAYKQPDAPVAPMPDAPVAPVAPPSATPEN